MHSSLLIFLFFNSKFMKLPNASSSMLDITWLEIILFTSTQTFLVYRFYLPQLGKNLSQTAPPLQQGFLKNFKHFLKSRKLLTEKELYSHHCYFVWSSYDDTKSLKTNSILSHQYHFFHYPIFALGRERSQVVLTVLLSVSKSLKNKCS